MIPTIGIMIGGYILLRALEILCRSHSAFSSSTARALVIVCALLVMAVTGFEILDLLLSSSRATVGMTGSSEPTELQRQREENRKLFERGKPER